MGETMFDSQISSNRSSRRNPFLGNKAQHHEDGSFGHDCLIRYEDDEGVGVPDGECYTHKAGDPACEFQDHLKTKGEWPEGGDQ